MKNCTECGHWTKTDFCASCRERRETAVKLLKAEMKIRDLRNRVDNQAVELAKQRRYTVHPKTMWENLTWNEAIERADWLFALGVHYIDIEDEHGLIIRKYSPKKKVTA